MNELIDKVKELENVLDNEECIKRIKKVISLIQKDKELIKLIDEYRVTRNEEIKNRIISNPLYSEYKHLENEVNFIILDIRKELSKINDKKGCIKHENN